MIQRGRLTIPSLPLFIKKMNFNKKEFFLIKIHFFNEKGGKRWSSVLSVSFLLQKTTTPTLVGTMRVRNPKPSRGSLLSEGVRVS
jgi:hypothetical protein